MLTVAPLVSVSGFQENRKLSPADPLLRVAAKRKREHSKKIEHVTKASDIYESSELADFLKFFSNVETLQKLSRHTNLDDFRSFPLVRTVTTDSRNE